MTLLRLVRPVQMNEPVRVPCLDCVEAPRAVEGVAILHAKGTNTLRSCLGIEADFPDALIPYGFSDADVVPLWLYRLMFICFSSLTYTSALTPDKVTRLMRVFVDSNGAPVELEIEAFFAVYHMSHRKVTYDYLRSLIR